MKSRYPTCLSLRPKLVLRALLLVAWAALLAACNRETPPSGPEPVVTAIVLAPTEMPSPTPTPSATPTPSPTATLTPTPAPTPTATPTATPVPILVTGAPGSWEGYTPSPRASAACRVVDFFDFALDPPDAKQAYLGQGFARGTPGNRQHAGEDWWMSRRASLGAPVYSIGHGRVTYAQPLGWGRDKGVVIVEHVLEDGSSVLSFYGHLDPPSVTLQAGGCVERGDLVGAIGRPRSSPHLHFEIRTHMPTEPGPGYWPDPTTAGWRNPSRAIWNSRIAAVPGVVWAQPHSGQFLRILGQLDQDTFVTMERNALVAIAGQDGAVRWRLPMPSPLVDGLIAADAATLYALDANAQLAAFDLGQQFDGSPPGSRWRIQLDLEDAGGAAALTPLPGGGVAVSAWRMSFNAAERQLTGQRQVRGVSSSGGALWEQTITTPIHWQPGDDHWVLAGDRLVLASMVDDEVSLWVMDESGITAGPDEASGRPVSAGQEARILGQDGVYRLDPLTLSAQLVLPVPENLAPGGGAFEAGAWQWGDMLLLEDGSVLLAHEDWKGRRLALVDEDGSLRWVYSYDHLALGDPAPGRPDLVLLDNRPYLLLQDNARYSTLVNLYAVDLEQPALRHLFSAGGPAGDTDPASLWALDDGRLLISIDRGSMALLELEGSQSIGTGKLSSALP